MIWDPRAPFLLAWVLLALVCLMQIEVPRAPRCRCRVPGRIRNGRCGTCDGEP